MSYSDHVGYLPSINDTISCPYNTAHTVGITRAQRHLTDCRKKNPAKAAAIVICAYNQSHHIPAVDYSAHLVICRDHLAHKFQTVIRLKDPKTYGGPALRSQPVDPLKARANELRLRVDTLEREEAGYFGDADTDVSSVVSGCSGSMAGAHGGGLEGWESGSESGVVGNPCAEWWTVVDPVLGKVCPQSYNNEGARDPLASPVVAQAKEHELHLPPCSQEEIDNWK